MKPILAISEQSHKVLGLFLKIRNICIGFSAFLPMIYFWFLRNLTCCPTSHHWTNTSWLINVTHGNCHLNTLAVYHPPSTTEHHSTALGWNFHTGRTHRRRPRLRKEGAQEQKGRKWGRRNSGKNSVRCSSWLGQIIFLVLEYHVV